MEQKYKINGSNKIVSKMLDKIIKIEKRQLIDRWALLASGWTLNIIP